MTTSSPSSKDRFIPWYFVAFFVVVAIIDGTFAIIAVRTHTGIVTSNPYERGLAYNNILQAAEKQHSLGLIGNINFIQTTGNSGSINFTLKNDTGTISPDNVTATIFRPTQSGMDFNIKLTSQAPGVFTANITFPKQGLWEIRIHADLGDNVYQKSRRVVVE